jgi:hypothetical protein
MTRSIILWIVAVAITLGLAVYQRMTGPTYPISGVRSIEGEKVSYRFERSHPGASDHEVRIPVSSRIAEAWLEWRRYRSADEWVRVPMAVKDSFLTAPLPHQPPAGKLEYRVQARGAGQLFSLPEGDPVVIRFRGDVPWYVIIPHVLMMFLSMLLSTRAGLEVFAPSPKLRPLVLATIGTLFVGGLMLGPIVQKYAFDAYWTGWPFGRDLTDNKTAAAFLIWAIAAFGILGRRKKTSWALIAAVAMMVVYLIPHSMLGSELDYSKEAARPPLEAPVR